MSEPQIFKAKLGKGVVSKIILNGKKGGPYTKKEREERRLKVFHLHFEEKIAATKIAEMLDVHRNTIDEDISFWDQQLSHEFKPQDLTSKIIKQIHRMELQRDRLYEYFENAQGVGDELALERIISDIDIRLERLYSNMLKHEESELVKRLEKLEQLSHFAQETKIQP